MECKLEERSEKQNWNLTNILMSLSLNYGGKWLKKTANSKVTNKQAKIYVGRSLTLHIFLFMLIDYTWNYIIAMLLVVSCITVCISTHSYLLYLICQVLCRLNPQNSQRIMPGFLTFNYAWRFNRFLCCPELRFTLTNGLNIWPLVWTACTFNILRIHNKRTLCTHNPRELWNYSSEFA